MGENFHLETRFSGSRGLFPYIVGAAAVAVVIVIVLALAGAIKLPYSEYFAARAPTAADGSPAISLLTVSQKEEEKTVTITGTIRNRAESAISGLQAVITVKDNFTLPVQTLIAPVVPEEFGPKTIGIFQATVTAGETGFGGYSIDFRLSDDGPFVPHKDERPSEPVLVEEKTR